MFENVRITTLPNGAKVATSAMPGVNSCAVSVFVPTGSRHERKSEAGWSHFAEHMAFKGSERYPSRRAIVRALDRFGGNYNASTGRERTRYEACVPARGTAYSIHSCPGLSSDANTFHVRAEVDAANLEKAVGLCGRELRAMAAADVGRRELADKKTEFENALLLVGETSQSQRNNLEASLATWGAVVAPETHAARYRAVAAEEIRTLAAELFRPENCTLGLILPHDCKADPEKLREALFNG